MSSQVAHLNASLISYTNSGFNLSLPRVVQRVRVNEHGWRFKLQVFAYCCTDAVDKTILGLFVDCTLSGVSGTLEKFKSKNASRYND